MQSRVTRLFRPVQSSRMTRSDEDREVGWDAWGTWSDCSRTCGGGASYSLRRCLSGSVKSCEGRNIRYRTCSNMDCPVDAGDFRAQQCSAHNDVKYQGHTYEWLPATHDPAAPCTLRCQARGQGLVVELAPKVLDGTRCRADSLDMCINGVCKEVGCDHQLGSNAREDNCGVCAGDGSTCRLMRGQALSHVSAEESVKMVVEIPLGSRNVRVTAKGPDLMIVEMHTLQGQREEYIPGPPGAHVIGNTSVELQKGLERLTLRAPGPLAADFIIKDTAPRNTLVQFMFYQPIRYQWRETDFFPCTVTCGGGYQLNSAECVDTRLNRVVPDHHHCNLYPENKKPKPKLRECNLDFCPESDGFKEVMPYDQFQPLPRWELNPWTMCSASCGGGTQSRSVVCVEEDVQGQVAQAEEWKCAHSSRPAEHQDCNTFDCPQWAAMEWSQCTVTCGRGLRYRVVLCLDHRGQHAGGCDAGRKPHVKEDCLVPVACYRPRETLPVEAKMPWQKLAQELEEPKAASEEPTFISGPWLPCSASCGPGWQSRWVKCQVLLSFTQTEVDLPDEECGEDRPLAERPCNLGSCGGISGTHQKEPHYGWEHVGFTACSSTCAAGTQEAMVKCLRLETRETVDESFCNRSRRPLATIRVCNPHPCPPRRETLLSPLWETCNVGQATDKNEPGAVRLGTGAIGDPLRLGHLLLVLRWESGPWTQCTATCGVGIQTRSVYCRQLRSLKPMDVVAVPDAECLEFKPSVLRACNQVDCPAAWHTDEWQQCSHTCGGGTQSRKVHCKQRLSTGGFRKLPDTSCPGVKPVAHKSCARTSCPPQMPKQPYILGLHRIYIQTRQEKRIHLTVGGRAYLLPKTSVVIKCPVRRFQKHHIRWEKDGKGLIPSRRLGITKSGSLKIHGLEAADIGVYRCVAGLASETFVLKLIGNNNRLVDPPKVNGIEVTPRNTLAKQDQGHSEEMWKHMNTMWQNWSQKNEYYLDDSQAQGHDEAFLQVLHNYLTSTVQPPDTHLELSVLRGGHSLEPRHLEELLRNISVAGERMNGNVAKEQMTPSPGKRPTSGGEAKPSTVLLNRTANASEQMLAESKAQSKKPAIVQQKLYPVAGFQENIRMSIGQKAILTNATRSVLLLCISQGAPEPNITWTKDGEQLQSIDTPSGCPIHPNHREPISWSFQNRTLQEVLGPRYRVLAAGRVLEVNPLSGKSAGIYRCQSAIHSQLVSAWVHVSVDACSVSCGSRGVQSRRVRCTSAGGQDMAPALCLHLPRPASPSQPCNVRDCPPSWEATVWSECSVSCGLGFRQRQVRCHQRQAQGTLRVLPESMCGAALRPPDREECHSHVCAVWRTSPWGQCSGRCVGPALAMQSRPVVCQHTNGSSLPESHCDHRTRPASARNCTWEVCANQWRTGPWRACSADCGSGFQSRKVECVHRRTSRILADQHCAWQRRPIAWQHCNVMSCACRDSTHYCTAVRRLQLCPLGLYKQRCCQTCQEEAPISP
uniref:ADAMTS like 3 n=1 Tax=Scleropages formosus TaxID=113540 RepID=A0A8C9TLG5_SCLFO